MICGQLSSAQVTEFVPVAGGGMFINIWAAIGLGPKLIFDVVCHPFGTLKLNFDAGV